jgi:hypothetical protein
MLTTRNRFFRFSILKETPAALQAFLVPLCPVRNLGQSQTGTGVPPLVVELLGTSNRG